MACKKINEHIITQREDQSTGTNFFSIENLQSTLTKNYGVEPYYDIVWVFSDRDFIELEGIKPKDVNKEHIKGKKFEKTGTFKMWSYATANYTEEGDPKLVVNDKIEVSIEGEKFPNRTLTVSDHTPLNFKPNTQIVDCHKLLIIATMKNPTNATLSGKLILQFDDKYLKKAEDLIDKQGSIGSNQITIDVELNGKEKKNFFFNLEVNEGIPEPTTIDNNAIPKGKYIDEDAVIKCTPMTLKFESAQTVSIPSVTKNIKVDTHHDPNFFSHTPGKIPRNYQGSILFEVVFTNIGSKAVTSAEIITILGNEINPCTVDLLSTSSNLEITKPNFKGITNGQYKFVWKPTKINLMPMFSRNTRGDRVSLTKARGWIRFKAELNSSREPADDDFEVNLQASIKFNDSKKRIPVEEINDISISEDTIDSMKVGMAKPSQHGKHGVLYLKYRKVKNFTEPITIETTGEGFDFSKENINIISWYPSYNLDKDTKGEILDYQFTKDRIIWTFDNYKNFETKLDEKQSSIDFWILFSVKIPDEESDIMEITSSVTSDDKNDFIPLSTTVTFK